MLFRMSLSLLYFRQFVKITIQIYSYFFYLCQGKDCIYLSEQNTVAKPWENRQVKPFHVGQHGELHIFLNSVCPPAKILIWFLSLIIRLTFRAEASHFIVSLPSILARLFCLSFKQRPCFGAIFCCAGLVLFPVRGVAILKGYDVMTRAHGHGPI